MKTKRIKFLAVAVTLLIGISFTSCLNSDNDGQSTYNMYGRVSSYMGIYYTLTDINGNTYTPSFSAAETANEKAIKDILDKSKMVQVSYQLVENSNQTKATQAYNIRITGISSMDGVSPQIIEQDGDPNDSIATASIKSIDFTLNNSNYAPFMFDKDIVILPISFYLTGTSEMFSQHSFTLVGKIQNTDSNLTFELRHRNGKDISGNTDAALLIAYDLSSSLSRFRMVTGHQPSKIIIKTKENAYSQKLADATDNSFEIDYTKIAQ